MTFPNVINTSVLNVCRRTFDIEEEECSVLMDFANMQINMAFDDKFFSAPMHKYFDFVGDIKAFCKMHRDLQRHCNEDKVS